MAGPEQQLREYLAKRRSEWGGMDRFELIAAGWESDIYAFTVPAVGRLVLRLYTGDEASRNAAREPLIMATLGEGGYPVPAVVLSEPNPAPLGRPFMLMEHIDGEVMWNLMKDPERASGLVDQFGALMVSLHRLDPAPFLRVDGVTDFDLPARNRSRLEAWRREAVRVPDFDPVLAWLLAELERVPPEVPTVVHHDFHPGNVLVGPDGRATVVDWTHAEVADPRIDLAWTLLLAGAYDAGREQFQASYARHSGKRFAAMAYFDALVATIRLYDFAVSLTYGPEAMGMRAGAADEMRASRASYVWVRDLLHERTGLRIGVVDELLG